MRVRPFYRKWLKLRETIRKKDLDLFYKVVDIDGSVGRVFSFDISYRQNVDPRYLQHWFPTCRCHWAVILPLWLLNNKEPFGKFSIITNEKHSAIINTETQEIYDPTYTANQTNLATTLEQFKTYEINNITQHFLKINPKMFERFCDILTKKQRALVLIELKKVIDLFQNV